MAWGPLRSSLPGTKPCPKQFAYCLYRTWWQLGEKPRYIWNMLATWAWAVLKCWFYRHKRPIAGDTDENGVGQVACSSFSTLPAHPGTGRRFSAVYVHATVHVCLHHKQGETALSWLPSHIASAKQDQTLHEVLDSFQIMNYAGRKINRSPLTVWMILCYNIS